MRAAYRQHQIAQARLGRTLIELSPTGVFQNAITAVADLGFDRSRNFYYQVREYRDTFHRFIIAKDLQDSSSAHLVNWSQRWLFSNKPVPPGEIPVFTYRQPDVTGLFLGAASGIILLAAFNSLFFLVAIILFHRYDVR